MNSKLHWKLSTFIMLGLNGHSVRRFLPFSQQKYKQSSQQISLLGNFNGLDGTFLPQVLNVEYPKVAQRFFAYIK